MKAKRKRSNFPKQRADKAFEDFAIAQECTPWLLRTPDSLGIGKLEMLANNKEVLIRSLKLMRDNLGICAALAVVSSRIK